MCTHLLLLKYLISVIIRDLWLQWDYRGKNRSNGERVLTLPR